MISWVFFSGVYPTTRIPKQRLLFSELRTVSKSAPTRNAYKYTIDILYHEYFYILKNIYRHVSDSVTICFLFQIHVKVRIWGIAVLSKADLAEKLGKKKTPPPKEIPKIIDDPLSTDPEFSKMVEDSCAESPLGDVKIQLKSQSKRSPIAVFMLKAPGENKFSQKLQIVVKPPGVLAIDAMAILKFIAAQFMDGEVKVESLKERKGFLVGCLEKSTLLEEFQRSGKRDGDAEFFDIYKKRMERATLQQSAPPNPTGASSVIGNIGCISSREKMIEFLVMSRTFKFKNKLLSTARSDYAQPWHRMHQYRRGEKNIENQGSVNDAK